VRIHFDGWTDRFDYWCTLDDPDLFPAGFMNYIRQKSGWPYKKMSQFDPPRGMNRSTFTWESYLETIDQDAVPFNLFTDVNLN
jgi:hypothetical protein